MARPCLDDRRQLSVVALYAVVFGVRWHSLTSLVLCSGAGEDPAKVFPAVVFYLLTAAVVVCSGANWQGP